MIRVGHFSSLLLFLLLFFSAVYGQQKTLGLTKNQTGSADNGYILFAPLDCKTTYLIDKCGRKVHSWESKYPPGFSAYLLPNGNLLRTGTYKDTSLIKGSNGGVIEKMDWNGNILWSYILLNDSLGQHHDIYPMDNGNILVVSRHVISETKALAKGRKPGTFRGSKLYSERILEIRPKGINDAEVVWQWSLWDHIIQDENSSKPNYGIVKDHPELMNVNYAPTQSADWIHINSIDYNKELDQILLSCKSINEIWIIDHSTTTQQAALNSGGNSGMGGDILYRWGNPAAYDNGDKTDQKFFHQHNAHWIPEGFKDGGDIMIFNNGLNRIPAYSSVDIITPPAIFPGAYIKNQPFGPFIPKWTYKDPVPDNFFSGLKSGAERLPNGNTLICSGLTGKFFEIDTTNSIVWEYLNPVAPADSILTEGATGGSVVFKCTYYADCFSGFKGKSLTPLHPIEKNPYPYSCLFPSDNLPPSPVTFFPAHQAKKVAINTPMSILFNENIYKASTGYVRIYENKRLKEVIPVSDRRVETNRKIVSISLSNDHTPNSYITISIDKGSIKDFSGNEIASDLLNWTFKTSK